MAQMPMSSRRSNRNGTKVIWIGLHTSEGPDRPNVNDAAGLRDATWWEGSSHAICDNEALLDETSGCVDPAWGAWTLRDGNPRSVNIEQIGYAGRSRAEWLNDFYPTIERAAQWVARMSKWFDIPITYIGIDGVRDSRAGVIQHNDYTQGTGDGTHWDCGSGYPIDVLIDLARDIAGGTPAPPPPLPVEDDMFSDSDRALLQYVKDQLGIVAPIKYYKVNSAGAAVRCASNDPAAIHEQVLSTLDGSYLASKLGTQSTTLAQILAKPAAELSDEDVAAIVAAIPDDIATRVADELGRRLDA